jgi:hypothetical protein
MGKGFLEARRQRYIQEREQGRAQLKRQHLFTRKVCPVSETAHGELVCEDLAADTELFAHAEANGAVAFYDKQRRCCVRIAAQEATEYYPRAQDGSLSATVSVVDPELQSATLCMESIGPCDGPG